MNVGHDLISSKETDEIYRTYEGFEPLHPEIKTAIKIVPADETTCSRGEEYCVLLYSEKKDGYLQNIGYLGCLLDLYLVSKNIGTLWFGIGKTEETTYNGMEFVIMIAVRKICNEEKFRKDMFKSKRKPLSEIWEGGQIESVTDIVRFAPSACNSQPWFVKNADGRLSVFRYKIMPADKVSYYNRIDLGLFLCFIEICLDCKKIKYERKLFPDDGSDNELTLNAEYIFV